MNVIVWLLAGAAVGWVACSALRLNANRGLIASALIGVVGAFFGGHVVAQAFGAEVSAAGGFSPFALLVASVSALASLKIADMVYERFEF